MHQQTPNNILSAYSFWLFWQFAGVQSVSFYWPFKLIFEFLCELKAYISLYSHISILEN